MTKSGTRPSNGDGPRFRYNQAKSYFEQLEGSRDEVEKELGESLVWFNPDWQRVCRIFLYRDAALENRDNWPEYHAWLLEKLLPRHTLIFDFFDLMNR